MSNPAVCEDVKRQGLLARIGLWLKRQIVTEVPSGIARCEFECRLAKCSPERIRDCKNRIAYAEMASSEKDADP